jgi:hypothetical protein
VIITRTNERHCFWVWVIVRCRKRDGVSKTIEYIIGGCSSLSESTCLGRHNQMAEITHQQIAIKYKLLYRNTLPYSRYKPEPVVESVTRFYIRTGLSQLIKLYISTDLI